MCSPAFIAPLLPGVTTATVAGSTVFASVATGATLTTGAALATGLPALGQLIGTGISVLGQIRQASAARNESTFRSQIAANNAIIAQQNAIAELERGRADIRDVRRDTAQKIGSQRARLAAQGFDVSQGTSIDILGDTAALGELDVLRVEADADNRANNLLVQASGFEAEVTLGRFERKNIKAERNIGVASTLITGAVLALKP